MSYNNPFATLDDSSSEDEDISDQEEQIDQRTDIIYKKKQMNLIKYDMSLSKKIQNQYIRKSPKGYTNKKDQMDKDKLKRLLCANVLEQGYCSYGDKCLYAHSIEQQRKDPIRKKVYALIEDKLIIDLLNLDKVKDKDIYEEMIMLTKVCKRCIHGDCPGGYNCKHGVCKREFQLCKDDLLYGSCHTRCSKIHLSALGLKPLRKEERKPNHQYFRKTNSIWDTPPENIYKPPSSVKKYIYKKRKPPGVLMQDHYLFKLAKQSQSDDDTCSDIDNDEIEEMKDIMDQIENENSIFD